MTENLARKQVILVSTGVFQTYIKENVNQLLKLDYDIHVIIDLPFFKLMDEYKSLVTLIDTASLHTVFDKNSILDRRFRDGFWNNASKRLFLVYEYMKMNNLKNVIHLENDVLLYSNMDYNFDENVYITMDSVNRCIPGIIYIPNYNLFTNLIENYDYTQNDMVNLAKFYTNNKDIVKTFPIIDGSIDKCMYNENFQEFNSIFDAAAIGQYLGGVDPRNISGDTRGFINETCVVKYNKYKFKWVKGVNAKGVKGDDYFPFIEINDKLIAINNLHIHCKRLENFRMGGPTENKYIRKHKINFITGEKIQFSCDHFVGTDRDFRYNPNVAHYKNRFIYVGSNVHVDNKPLVFCYTHLLDNINELVKTLKGLQNPFKLVFHNSDRIFDDKHLILFEKLSLLQLIYTQNINVEHEKVFPLPIGLANSQWTHGNPKIHQDVYDMPIEKTKEIYFNFSIGTNKEKRNKCYNDVIKKGIKWNTNLPYREYLIELKRHKYAICPEGNGIDTHRFWECLYMNTIPICLKNVVTEYYKQYFPIIILNDWKELDVDKLSYSSIDHQRLDMGWIIKNPKQSSFINLHQNHIEIFTKIYETNEWGNNNHKDYKGSSGGGSKFSSVYNNFVVSFIKKHNIKSVIDLGCGDWQSSSQIYNKLNVTYHGYDAYKDVIVSHRKNFPKYNFYHLDIINSYQEIKNGDLCILKDILQHWTCNEIEYFLDRIQDKFKYILICNCKNQRYDYQDEPLRSRPLNVKYYPLKKYNPEIKLEFSTKQVSIIKNIPLTKYSLSRVDNTNNIQKVENLVDSFFHKSDTYSWNETTAYYPDGTIVSGGSHKPGTFYRHICYYTIKEALTHLVTLNKSEYTIVETGCASHGTKYTLIWDRFVNIFGGKVISVDLNQTAVNDTNAVSSSRTSVYCSDSLEFLPNLTEKIDFLYLDSYDVDFLNPKPSADHHLKEFYCVKELLSDNCIILIDDTPISPEWLDGGKRNHLYNKLKHTFNPDLSGKGSLVNHYLSQVSSEKIDHKYQVLWKFKGVPKKVFDIVIPVGPNDRSIIEEQIKYTKNNVIGYRNIYLICYDPSINIDGCITVNETIFPFNMETVAKYHGKLKRNGWYLQQLLKLYAGKVIPGILDKYLVIDSDTFFLKPTTFVETNKCLYNYGTEYHIPYFHHMKKLDKDLIKVDGNKSGICHHMIFETKYIDDIISKIEKNHNDLFYNVFLKTVTESIRTHSGASEYELYFNYMLKYNPDKIKIRKLNWKNARKLETNSNLDYISYHWYER